jgi:predicted Zn-ribbon and HTH transcriptional regulator
MSANGWKICPKCKAKIQADKDAELLKLGESYGKVDSQEYLKLANEASKEPEFTESLREDYEFYLDEYYVLDIDYVCSCEQCGFKFSFHKKIDILAETESA